jgi:hypothetical protein
MREEMAKGYAATLPMPYRPRLSANSESGQQVADEQIEVETLAVVEQHRRSGGGHYFGDAGEVENGHWGDDRRVGIIGETAHGIKGEDLAVQEDTKGRSGKSAAGDGAFQDGIGRSEPIPLI